MQEILSRMQRLDELIRIKGTGSPSELAALIGISERSVFDYLKIMKERGVPIRYDRNRKRNIFKEGSWSFLYRLPIKY